MRILNSSSVLDFRGNLAPMVIEYNRNYLLSKNMISKYVYWVNGNSNDPRTEWNNELSCRIYELLPDRNLFHKICDLISFRGISLASCCTLCNRLKGVGTSVGFRPCNGFTFIEGVCYMKNCIAVRNID